MKIVNSHFGFTLIEMLVSLTILMLILGGSLAGFITFRDRREAEQAGRQVQQLFISAQQKASVKETPSTCLGSNPPLQGYRVSYNSVTRTFSLVPLCANNPSPPAATTDLPSSFTAQTAIETYVVPANVTVLAGQTNFDFYTLERGTNAGATRTYSFTNGTTYQFTVDASGTISNVQ